ncbi:hypothetical protein [Thermodesulfobacterium thermophilum]|uniref:hypothetical protein n=1 Tax=Thermodesulfobacterium thermophilum TaxID=886 RepID=UPI0003B43D09|nr:hypothetical protein [Thermodesulfobacterium thermophilum]
MKKFLFLFFLLVNSFILVVSNGILSASESDNKTSESKKECEEIVKVCVEYGPPKKECKSNPCCPGEQICTIYRECVKYVEVCRP